MYVISPAACKNPNEIWDFTAKTWDDDQAETYYRKLVRCFEHLDNGTLRGQRVGGTSEDILRHSVESHVVFYRINRSGDIEIIRVLHKRMDATRHLPD